MRQLQRFRTAYDILRHRGVGYIFYLISGYAFPGLVYWLLDNFSPTRLKQVLKGLLFLFAAFLLILFHQWVGWGAAVTGLLIVTAISLATLRVTPILRTRKMIAEAEKISRQLMSAHGGNGFTQLSHLPISDQTRRAIENARQQDPQGELVIGEIDGDLRMYGVYGEIPILPPVSQAEFMRRSRFQLAVVLIGDTVLVRKDFRGDKKSFAVEWFNLVHLFGKANVSAVYKADVKKTLLYKNLILGEIVRDTLVRAGAKIMHMQTDDDPELNGLPKWERMMKIVARGTALVPACFSEDFLLEMERQINAIHACNITSVTPTFGNVILETKSGLPCFIDFEGARYSPRQNLLFHYHRDQDRKKFNDRFARNIHTEESTRRLLKEKQKSHNWYAPIDFGRGWAMSGFWSIGSGTGRWDVIERAVQPHIARKNILDLGSNNGIMPIMMLKHGASKVTGLELSPDFFEAAKLIHEIFEWRDLRAYDFDILNCNMLEILRRDWDGVDVVTAFCSLYYLTEQEMGGVVKRASEFASTMILQANTATRSEAAQEKSKKASLEFMRSLLQDNGFPIVDVFAPAGYNRPLLVGRKE